MNTPVRQERAELPESAPADSSCDPNQFNALVIDGAQVGIVVYGPDMRYRVWNRFMESFTGVKAADVIGRLPLDVFPFLKDAGVIANLQRALAGESTESAVFPFEVFQTGYSGWALDRTTPLLNHRGDVIGAIGTVTDITQQKFAENELNTSQQRFRDIVNTTDGIVWEADARTFDFTFVSQQAERLLGYPAADWLQPGFWVSRLHADDRAWAPEHYAACTRRTEPHDFEYRFIARDGRTVWLHDIVTVVAEDGAPRWLRGIMVDVTERKRTEQQLREMAEGLEIKVVERTAQLRELSAQLTMTEERERRKLAQELHDDLSQLLAVIKIKLTLMGTGAQQTSIDEIVQLVDQADRAARSVSQELSPPILHSLGLMHALQWLSDEIQRGYGLVVHVDTVECRKRLAAEEEAILYRSARELLINVAKHAGVSNASLTCLCDRQSMTLVVSDAGRGFDPAEHFGHWPGHRSFGLRSIYERITNIGGKMEIDSSPGNGTTIALIMPCAPPVKEICDDPHNACR